MVVKAPTIDPSAHTITWVLASGDTGLPVKIQTVDDTVHVFGTFDGSTLTMQGSNDPAAAPDNASSASANWATMQDNGDNALTFTAAGMKVIAPNPVYIRPSNSTGDGSTSVTVIIKRGGGSSNG